MTSAAIYIIAFLQEAGEHDWRETATSDPSKGTLRLTNGAGEKITYSYRFNSGDPMWFCAQMPRRMEGTNTLPDTYRQGRP